jgi:hypothetical protein
VHWGQLYTETSPWRLVKRGGGGKTGGRRRGLSLAASSLLFSHANVMVCSSTIRYGELPSCRVYRRSTSLADAEGLRRAEPIPVVSVLALCVPEARVVNVDAKDTRGAFRSGATIFAARFVPSCNLSRSKAQSRRASCLPPGTRGDARARDVRNGLIEAEAGLGDDIQACRETSRVTHLPLQGADGRSRSGRTCSALGCFSAPPESFVGFGTQVSMARQSMKSRVRLAPISTHRADVRGRMNPEKAS